LPPDCVAVEKIECRRNLKIEREREGQDTERREKYTITILSAYGNERVREKGRSRKKEFS
jgi:hypothetical protein